MSVELRADMTLRDIKTLCQTNKYSCEHCPLNYKDDPESEDYIPINVCILNKSPITWAFTESEEYIEPAPETQTNDPVSPAHYQLGQRQTLDEMLIIFGLEAVKAFCRCNVYKYKVRASRKNWDEDLAKADRYLTFYEHLCEYGHIKWEELEE